MDIKKLRAAIEVEQKNQYIDIRGRMCSFSQFILKELASLYKESKKNPEFALGILTSLGKKALVLSVNRNFLAVAAHTLKADLAVNQGEQGIVAALAHVLTGVNVGATLTNQNVAGQHELTVGALDAQTLGLGIAAVLGRTYAFFMCHCVTPPLLNR